MSSSARTRVVQFGLGSIGLMAVKAVLGRTDLELAGAIDDDLKKVERDVADLSGLRRPSGIRVSNRPQEVLGVKRPQVVLHATQSGLADVFPQLSYCLEAGAHVVSTCEELVFPTVRQPRLARDLDFLARSKGSVVLGTGANPGLVMDTMALVASAACLDVRSVRVERIVDASTRRESLQRKVGAGLTRSEFRRGLSKGTLGHRGLLESVHLIANGLGWDLDKVAEKVTPVLSPRSMKTEFVTIRKGEVAGIHHVCKGFAERKEKIRLDLQMFVGVKKPGDQINIKGKPDVTLSFEKGVAGDEATVAMLLNMIPAVLEASPGLRTMSDISVPRFRA